MRVTYGLRRPFWVKNDFVDALQSDIIVPRRALHTRGEGSQKPIVTRYIFCAPCITGLFFYPLCPRPSQVFVAARSGRPSVVLLTECGNAVHLEGGASVVQGLVEKVIRCERNCDIVVYV